MSTLDFDLLEDAQGRLILRRPGEEDVAKATLRRAFPWSNPAKMISVRSGEGKELLLIEDLASLPPALRKKIDDWLARHSFVPWNRYGSCKTGQILIDGEDIRDYDVKWLRRQIGMVLQEPYLFHGTIAENIRYGNAAASDDEVIRAARAANAHNFIVGFPDGYDTMVGERGQSLSGGERQRISIARAILHNPRILILDEATSSVDTETEKQIQQALDRLVEGRTTIAIAHRLSTLQAATRLVVLEKGRLVEQGTHSELVDKVGGVYAKLYKTQVELNQQVAIR